jgi:hypothetical protein
MLRHPSRLGRLHEPRAPRPSSVCWSVAHRSSLKHCAWRHFSRAFALTGVALVILLLGTVYVLDPFDTGRPGVFSNPGVRRQGPRTAGASRGRDPAFNAAIIGNSHVQLLSPERLNALTGLSFLQLSIIATGPKEHLPVLDWFMLQHPEARALVIGADRLWCEPELASWNNAPFPFWLYSRSSLEYLAGSCAPRLLRRSQVAYNTYCRNSRRGLSVTGTGITSRPILLPAT